MLDLFSALHKYPPSENQITEMLAQALAQEPALIERFFDLHIEGEPLIQTQVLVPEGGVAKWIDLAIFERKHDNEELAAIVEIKWWSGVNYSPDAEGLSRPQTDFYERFLKKERGNAPRDRLFYLTRIKGAVPEEWTGIQWVDIYVKLLSYLQEHGNETNRVGLFLADQFARFLEQESVPENEVEMAVLAQLPEAVHSVSEGFRLIREVYAQFSSEHKGKWLYQSRDLNGTISSQLFNHGRLALTVYAKPEPFQIMFALKTPDKQTREMMVRVWVECDPRRYERERHGEIIKNVHGALPQKEKWLLYEKPAGWATLMRQESFANLNSGTETAQAVRNFFLENLAQLHECWPS